MPIDVIRLENGEGLFLKVRAPFSGKDKIQVNEELLRSPAELARLRYAVIDHECTDAHLSTLEARIVAEQDKQIAKLTPDGLVLAIIAPTDLGFGVARMWQVFVEDPTLQTGVFRSRDDAAAWLDVKIGKNSFSSLAARAG